MDLKEKLLKFIKDEENGIKFPLNDNDDIKFACYEITENFLELPFQVEYRSNGDSDYWIQIEYCSAKINQTIIWNYDFENWFKSAEELVDALLTTKKGIDKFEKKLTAIADNVKR